MEGSKHVVFPVESREVVDFVSSPILLNSDEHSLHLLPPTDLITQNDNFIGNSEKLQPTQESADNQLYVASQSRRFTSHTSSRQHHIHSWHGIMNPIQHSSSQKINPIQHYSSQIMNPIQHSSSQNGTNSFISMRISQISKSLFSVNSKTNRSLTPTNEPDQTISFLSKNVQHDISLSASHDVPESRLDLKTKLINDTDASISVEVEHNGLEGISLNHEFGQRASTELESTFLLFLGFVANFCVLGPLLVVYWNNTWTVFDVYLFSEDCELSSWGSAVIGIPMTIAAAFLQNSVLRFSSSCRKPVRYFLMRFYTYVQSVVCINQWRSVWMIFTCYTEYSLTNAVISLVASGVLLTLLRSLRILPAPPVYLFHEVQHSIHYKVTTFWGATPEYSLNFLLDTLISVLFVQVLSITFWRGLWEVLDFCLFQDDPQMSAICSLGISLGLTVVLLPAQIKIKDISRRLHSIHWLLALSVQDVFTFLYTVVCITYWRGFWMLLNLHSPYRPESLFVAHGGSFIILAIGLTANTVLVRGVLRDGIDFGDYGTEIDLSYVITLIQAWRTQKERKQISSNGDPRLLPHPV